jgi:hypothetical protein
MNKNFKEPFGPSRTVPKRQRGVNDANQGFENEQDSACEEGLTGSCARGIICKRLLLFNTYRLGL